MMAQNIELSLMKDHLQDIADVIIEDAYNDSEESLPTVAEKPLESKAAVELIMSGKLINNVCRYCLMVTPTLTSVEESLNIAGTRGAVYELKIKDVIASFYPFEIENNSNCPEKICEDCLDRALNCYLFTQRCEQSHRAFYNFIDEIEEKLDGLDPLDQPKKKGRQKRNINHNKVYATNKYVIDYAEPLTNFINKGSALIDDTENDNSAKFECLKCWSVLPTLEMLLNHEKIHPKSMLYHCKVCGNSFLKLFHLKKHMRSHSNDISSSNLNETKEFQCSYCGEQNHDYKYHLQHIEVHKFKNILDAIVHNDVHDMCTVCFDSNKNLINLGKCLSLHGGLPELSGLKSVYDILQGSFPDMNLLLTSNQICESCLENSLRSYMFIKQAIHTKKRLQLCVDSMLNKISEMKSTDKSFFIEISKDIILPIIDNDEIDTDDEINEDLLKVEVLEDEFRIEESESSEEETVDDLDKKENEKILLNGLTNHIPLDVNEFLNFKLKKNKKEKYGCPLCNKYFISEYYLSKHIVKHINKKVLCNLCHKEFKTKLSLHEHKRMVHMLKNTSFYCCKVCGRAFDVESKKTAHEKFHSIMQCCICDKMFKNQKLYNCHMQRHIVRFSISNNKNMITCSFCEKCINKNDLLLHINKVHLQIKGFSCDMCEREFYTKSHLKHHKKIHNIFCKETCQFCNKTLSCRRKFVIHLRKHMKSKPFKCFFCPILFYSEGSRKKHMVKQHGGHFSCKVCKNVFSDKFKLNEHVKTHVFI